MQRLGKNDDRYRGETLNIEAVLDDILRYARQWEWRVETLTISSTLELHVMQRSNGHARRSLYFSSGIHGDEPAGPLAVRELLRNNDWPNECAIWLCPCLNPRGFALNHRENTDGVDLNRDYLQPVSPEIQAHVAWLERQPSFEVGVCLHEDWEAHGFYLYELNPEQRSSYAERIIEAVSRVCPIDESPVIEGRPASHGIIRPRLDLTERPRWPEAFYLSQFKTRLNYTLEAPSDFPLPVRVNALLAAVRTILTAEVAPPGERRPSSAKDARLVDSGLATSTS